MACSGGASSDDTAALPAYCTSLDDGGTQIREPGEVEPPSGKLYLQLLNSVSEDLTDPNIVGGLDYTLELLDTGAAQLTGSTEAGGDVLRTVGEGRWLFEAVGQRQGYDCAAEQELVVVGGERTRGCVELVCL